LSNYGEPKRQKAQKKKNEDLANLSIEGEALLPKLQQTTNKCWWFLADIFFKKVN
jgi:hypothetical protein